MRGNAKYGQVVLVGKRAKDHLEIRIGTAPTYEIAREEALLMLRATSYWSCIYVKDMAGHRITTVNKPVTQPVPAWALD
jgi:hypothetical protein